MRRLAIRDELTLIFVAALISVGNVVALLSVALYVASQLAGGQNF